MFDPKLKYQFVTATDYESVRGPDWPSYVDFAQHNLVPEWVYQEIDAMLTVREPYNPESFCVLPWHSQEIDWNGKSTHCCLLPKTYNIKKIKSDMLQGNKPEECQKCWNLEQQGLLSDRKLKNAALDTWSRQDLRTIVQESTVESSNTQILKLTTSYTCNSACVTCGSNASSFWNTIEQRIDKTIPIKKYSFIDVDQIKTQIDFKNLKILSLLGGEPLLEKNNFLFLQHLIDIGNTDVFVTVITNGSVRLSEKHVEMFSAFPNLNFCISIDGAGPVFEYLRWPLKWDDIVSNLDQYRSITNNVSVSYTISNLNILYHNETINWFRANNLAWNHNVVYTPSYFSPSVLPVAAKKIIKTSLSSREFDAFVGDENIADQDLWQQFQHTVKMQDLAKGIDIQDYLPEFCAITDLN